MRTAVDQFLADADGMVQGLRSELAGFVGRAELLESDNARLKTELTDKDKQIGEKDQEIAGLRTQLQAKTDELDAAHAHREELADHARQLKERVHGLADAVEAMPISAPHI